MSQPLDKTIFEITQRRTFILNKMLAAAAQDKPEYSSWYSKLTDLEREIASMMERRYPTLPDEDMI